VLFTGWPKALASYRVGARRSDDGAVSSVDLAPLRVYRPSWHQPEGHVVGAL